MSDAPEVNEALAEETLRRVAGVRDHLLEWIDADALFQDGLGARSRAYLTGEADPLGAAATLLALSHGEVATRFFGPDGPEHESRFDGFADAWTAAHGLGFAAEAFVELSGLEPVWVPRRSFGGSTSGVRRALPEDPMDLWWEAWEGGVQRMRELVSGADEPVLERLAGLRTEPVRRIVVSYLVPAREDWLDECCAAPPADERERSAQWMVWCSLRSAAQFERVRDVLGLGPYELVRDILATVVERVGPAPLAPLLAAALDDRPKAVHRDAVLELLATVPADETFAVLVERASDMHVARALATAARRYPDLARRLVPAPDRAPRPVPDAPAGALPPLLVRPPWKRTAPRGPVLRLTVPDERAVVWADGEREKWADAPKYRPEALGPDGHDVQLRRAIASVRRGDTYPKEEVVAYLHAPDEVIAPLLPGWTPPEGLADVPAWMRPLVARHELAVRDQALRIARSNAPGGRGPLVPFRDAEIAARMAEWLARRAGSQRPVRAWFGRHGLAAVPLLVPAALGGAAGPRWHAGHALRFVADRTDADRVVEAARGHGDAAADAVRRLLAGPDLVPPLRSPRNPAWADARVLPQVLLRDRSAALPAEATDHLVSALALADPGVADVRAACDPASLAEFGRALFEAWRAHGAPPRHAWALESLGLLGDDDTVRRLVPLIRDWPGAGLHSRAVRGLDVLAAIGTQVAHLHLHGLARKGKYPALRKHARDLVERVAKRADVPADRLAERLLPDYGLDADGLLTVDYGPRAFRAGFDGRLEPCVVDRAGHRTKKLPEPGKRDDPGLAVAALHRFRAMTAEVRTASASLVEALENAMTRRYAWTPEEFRALFADHPLARHVARRLVWTSGGAAFRVAEDGTLADVRDDAFVLPEETAVRVAHPVDLGGGLADWRGVFDDYEIVQPFAQLDRAVHTLTGDERAAGRTTRFDGLAVSGYKVRGLLRRGWTTGYDGNFTREHPGGLRIVLALDGEADAGGGIDWRVRELTIETTGASDPALASEALADVARLVAARSAAECP